MPCKFVLFLELWLGKTRASECSNTVVWSLSKISRKCRSSRPEVFLRKGVLKICSKFKKRCSESKQQITFRHEYSPVNLLYIFRTPFLKNSSGRLILKVINPFDPSVTFYIETIHFICTANQVTCFFYMKCNTSLE